MRIQDFPLENKQVYTRYFVFGIRTTRKCMIVLTVDPAPSSTTCKCGVFFKGDF